MIKQKCQIATKKAQDNVTGKNPPTPKRRYDVIRGNLSMDVAPKLSSRDIEVQLYIPCVLIIK